MIPRHDVTSSEKKEIQSLPWNDNLGLSTEYNGFRIASQELATGGKLRVQGTVNHCPSNIISHPE